MQIVNNKLKLKDSIILDKNWPEEISPAGFDIDDARQIDVCCYKRKQQLYIVRYENKTKIDSKDALKLKLIHALYRLIKKNCT